MSFGGFRSMWVIVMFDLPMMTKESRKNYRIFREFLLADGFTRMQYSVYVRHTPSEENARVHESRVHSALPPDGEVRILRMTDKQFEKIRVFYGRLRGPSKKAPEQISFF